MTTTLRITSSSADIVLTPPSQGSVTLSMPEAPVPFVMKGLAVGPPGPPGSAFVFTQASAATQWTIAHNLGFRPGVTVTTLGGVEVIGGEVTHLSVNTLQIDFDTAFAGQARLT